MAYRRASLIDLYLRTKFHQNQKNCFWTDVRMDGRTFEPHIDIIRSTLRSWPKNSSLYNNDMFILYVCHSQWHTSKRLQIIKRWYCPPPYHLNVYVLIHQRNLRWLHCLDVEWLPYKPLCVCTLYSITDIMQGLGRFSCAWNVPYVTHHNFEVDYPP